MLRAVHLHGGLTKPNVDKAIKERDFETHISGRLVEMKLADRWCDVMIPINFGKHWVLLILNFEKRKMMVVYYYKEVAKEALDTLLDFALILVKESVKAGVSGEREWYQEK